MSPVTRRGALSLLAGSGAVLAAPAAAVASASPVNSLQALIAAHRESLREKNRLVHLRNEIEEATVFPETAVKLSAPTLGRCGQTWVYSPDQANRIMDAAYKVALSLSDGPTSDLCMEMEERRAALLTELERRWAAREEAESACGLTAADNLLSDAYEMAEEREAAFLASEPQTLPDLQTALAHMVWMVREEGLTIEGRALDALRRWAGEAQS